MKNLENQLYNYIKKNGIDIKRCNCNMREINGFNFSIINKDLKNIKVLNKNEKEYKEYLIYKKMSSIYSDFFIKELNRDKYSRKLIIQFSIDYHFKENKNLMCCPENFAINFINDNEYVLFITLRSSDIFRLFTDIRIIYTICKSFLKIKGDCIKININIYNFHFYINNKEREEFNNV